MCGISGALQRDVRDDDWLARLEGMANAIVHRGPDDGGVWFDPQAGVGLASRRLAIIDLSPEGHQPMCSASGRFVIAFNGEIYNFRDVRRELEARGDRRTPVFRGHSDTEVLLAAIEHWGLTGALRRVVGMFAFALWDRRHRRLHLVRDRIGEKPLYYGWMGDAFLFGSELKALRSHPTFRGTIDRDALALYMRHSYVPMPFSIYHGVRKLPPGSLLTLDAERAVPGSVPAPVSYWSARTAVEDGLASPFPGDAAEAADHLDHLLRDAIRQQMVANVPLGAFLSGGVDSSTVVALMQAQSRQPVKTFTIGFHEAAYNEADDARAVARSIGTDHTELYVTPTEAMDVIPRLPTLYDEPFADASQIPTFLVSRLARQQVTVSLSGDAGDELFGGYTRYAWATRIWRSVGWMPRRVRGGAAAGLTRLSPLQWDRFFTVLAPITPHRFRELGPGDKLHKAARTLVVPDREAMYRALVSSWDDPTSLVIASAEPRSTVTDRSAWPPLSDFAQWMMYLDMVSYLPDDILVKVDRASMGVSLEARVPFLDHRVVEFAWRLPRSMKIREGQSKWLLRQVLYRYVPRELVERPKTGFGVPIGSWLRGPLRGWAEELLSETRLRGDEILHPAPVRQRWDEHLSGRLNRQYPLWNVLMFQAWLDAERAPMAALTPTTMMDRRRADVLV